MLLDYKLPNLTLKSLHWSPGVIEISPSYALCIRYMLIWDFQNKGKSGWTGKSSFVLEIPLRPSVIYSVPCDRILQRAYSLLPNHTETLATQATQDCEKLLRIPL